MKIGDMVSGTFAEARRRIPELHAKWIQVSCRVGGQLPASSLFVSIQRDGDLDLVIRCMEEEALPIDKENPSPAFHYQKMLSELWLGSVYEVFRLLNDRQLAPKSEKFESLFRDLTLVRVPLDKNELAGERKLAAPVLMQRSPPHGDQSDFYEYSRADRRRAHIISSGISQRASVMWQATDVRNGIDHWVERRDISDRFLALWAA